MKFRDVIISVKEEHALMKEKMNYFGNEIYDNKNKNLKAECQN